MKIVDVRCENYEMEVPMQFTASGNRSGKMGVLDLAPSGWRWESDPSETTPRRAPFSVIRIETDAGVEGQHVASAVTFSPRVIPEREVKILRDCLIGRDPLDRELIWHDMWVKLGYDGGNLRSLAAFDCALWDLAGKLAGLPVHKLLGGYRDRLPVYACSWHLDSADEYYQDVLASREAGIKAYKLHVRADIAIDACRAAREAGGDEMVLMLDGGTGYSYEQALRVGRELERLKYYWFEEPVRDHDTYSLRKLRGKLDIPICAGEKVKWSMYDAATWIANGYADFIRTDTDRAGGITPCKKIADMCESFGIMCEIHYGGYANLQVQGAIKNCRFYELMWPEPQFGLLSFPRIDDDGFVSIPDTPGLGSDIDWDTLGQAVDVY